MPTNPSRRVARNNLVRSGAFFTLLSLMSLPVSAASLDWNGSAGNDWFNAANWTPSQVPTSSDDAVIDANATVLIAGAVPATFNSLRLGAASGATVPVLRVTGTISSPGSLTIHRNASLRQETAQASTLGQLSVSAGGSITHLGNSSSRSYLINLSVTGDFDLQAGATIAAAGKGYAGGTSSNGSGPGAGRGATGFCDSTGGGAGHGGAGGAATTRNLSPGGGTYDVLLDPSDLGSGGGATGDPGCGGGPAGGSGGGAIILTVGNTATLSGLVTADGANGGVGAGGGSGGTINIKAGTLAGSGILQANGGSSGGGGGGGAGAGLIALSASASNSFNGQVSAVAGTGGINGGAGAYALKVAPASGFDLTVDGRGVVPSTYTTIPFNVAGLNNLTISTANVFSTTFTVLNDLTLGPKAILTAKQVTVGRDLVAASQAASNISAIVVVQRDAVLYNGSVLTASSMSVTRDMVVRTGAQLKHLPNAGTRQFWLGLTIGNNFEIQAGATVNLLGAGYAGGTSANGSGPGFGRGATGFCGSTGGGAGHGGPGGRSATFNLSAGGVTYDSSSNPSDLGSGGGAAGDPGCGASPDGGGGGGMLIAAVGNLLTLDGTINANGADGGVGAGGGSGGTINVKAGSFAGTGSAQASGGTSGGSGGGGGGGGRMALTGCGVTQVNSAVSGATPPGGGAAGGAGTVQRATLPSCPEPPLPPVNLAVASTGSTPSGGAFLTASWNTDLAATSYTLQLAADSAFTVGLLSQTTAVSSGTFSDLLFRTTYYLRVRATNGYGDSAYSSTLVASVIPSIVDNADSLIVPAGSTYTLSGTRSYANSIVVDGTLLVGPLNGVTSGFLELSAPLVRVNAGGVLSADGAGFASGQGPGAGYSASAGQFDDSGGGGGGGYGGFGGTSDRFHPLGGMAHGSLGQPLDLGSGGGPINGVLGGRGGGRVRITAGSIRVDGRVSADGLAGAENVGSSFRVAGGGGSGGAIWLAASTMDGSGVVTADGGTSVSPDREGGGGGGGRVAATFAASTFSGTLRARGGIGWIHGGAGTVVYGGELRIENAVRGASTTINSGSYTFDSVRVATNAVVELTSAAAVTAGTLIVEGPSFLNIYSGSFSAQQVAVRYGATLRYAAGSLTADGLTVSTGGVFTLDKNLSLSQMTVLAGGLVTHDVAQSGFDLAVSGDMTVEAGGRISADVVGFPSLQGPGAGYLINAGQFDDQRGGGGGGYGGLGGAADRFHALSGAAYGSLTQPSDLGSGGGTANGNVGGAGGGKLRISAGTLKLDGSISANGGDGADSPSFSTFHIAGGGGAGGSIRLSVTNLSGGGSVTANGGASFSTNRSGGGGGGGRVAVDYGSSSFTGPITALGGAGLQRGGAGTVVYGSELRIVNSIQGASTTIPSGAYSFDAIKIATGAIVELTPSASLSAPNLTVTGPAILKLTAGTLTVPRIELFSQSLFRFDAGALAVTDLFVDSGAVLTVDTRLQAAQLVVRSGGLVNHAPQYAAFELSIANALTVESGARISADAAGFLSAQGPGAGYAVTAGSPFDSGGGGGGGAYGGLGGRSDNFHTFSGAIYGSLVQPLELGSGGGGIGVGGIGGGRLKIGAGAIQLDGRISADGGTSAPGTFTTGGGGSGGAISITAGSIQGAGVVSARGGNSYTPVDRLGGGGGGGRIALFYGSRSGAWSAAAAGGTGKVTGQPGTVLDNGQVSGLDTSASSATIAASQMTPRLESTRDLSETIGAQLLDFTGAISTGTAAGTFSRADIRLVLVKSGSFSEKGFFRGNWAINLSALASLTGEWEGMAYLAPDEPRRLYIKGILKGQIRGTIDGTLVESATGSGVFDRLSAACRVVQVDAAVGAGDMFVNGSGVQRENSQHPGTGIKLLQTSLTGLAAGYYASPLDVTFTFVRVNSPGNPYHGEGFFVASYNSSVGAGSGWAYASSTDQAARLSGFLDSAMRGLMEGALILSDPKSLLLTLQNLDVGLPFLPELLLDFTGPSNGNSGTKVTFAVTVRNNGYSVADGISVVAVYPLGTDFTSASGNYRVYSVVNPAQSFEFPQPFVRWDFPHIAARSSVTMNYQAFVRLPGPGMPASGSKLGGDIQVITTDWADKIFTGYEDRGAP